MKYLLVVVVVVFMAWWLLGRRRPETPVHPDARTRRAPSGSPVEMTACAHCGLHLPSSEALRDERGRPYCGEAHRRAGSR